MTTSALNAPEHDLPLVKGAWPGNWRNTELDETPPYGGNQPLHRAPASTAALNMMTGLSFDWPARQEDVTRGPEARPTLRKGVGLS